MLLTQVDPKFIKNIAKAKAKAKEPTAPKVKPAKPLSDTQKKKLEKMIGKTKNHLEAAEEATQQENGAKLVPKKAV